MPKDRSIQIVTSRCYEISQVTGDAVDAVTHSESIDSACGKFRKWGDPPPHPIEVEEGLQTGGQAMSPSDRDNSTKLEVVLMSGILSFTKELRSID
ncbi:MAG: hypothetical protein D6728_20365 [Cyanobacteria bacterium J055]|nr:MAG: hypothetical protein D6728_20365 [Cyanobacteria bacterium J055]